MTNKAFWLVILISALAVGLLYALPQIFIKLQVNESGNDFILSQFTYLHDGGDVYIQFAREVVDGHFPPGDLFFSERKPNIYPPLPPLILAGVIALFKDVNTSYIAANFIFGAILFVMFYFLGLAVFEKNKLWSLFMGFVGILTPIAIHLPYGFFTPANFSNIILKNFYPGVQTFLPTLFLARIDYPLLTHLIYLPAIAAFFLFWLKPKPVYAILTGVFSGLLFYTYFHKWVYWVTVLGLLFLYVLIFRRKDKERLRNFLILIAVIAVVSIPYFINNLQLNSLPSINEYLGRLELEVGRTFRWNAWPHFVSYALLTFLVYWNFWKKSEMKERAVLYWGFLAAAFIVWNVQLIIGFVPHSDHWPRAISPLVFLITFNLIYSWSQKWNVRWVKIALVLLISLLVIKKIVNAAGFISLPEEQLRDYIFPKDVVSSFKWMDANLKEPRVVSTSFVNSMYLSAFTSARPFLPWGGATPISNLELEELFLKANKIFGVSNDVLEEILKGGGNLKCSEDCDWLPAKNNLTEGPSLLYSSYYRGMADWPEKKIPDEKMAELLRRYRQLEISPEELGADYIYYGPLERSFSKADFGREFGLEISYQNESVKIYKIR